MTFSVSGLPIDSLVGLQSVTNKPTLTSGVCCYCRYAGDYESGRSRREDSAVQGGGAGDKQGHFNAS